VYQLFTQQKPRRLTGVTLNLCSAHAAVNFCHWLLDAMGRLELFRRCGYTFDQVDRILVPKFSGPTPEWVLQRLRLPPEKMIHPGGREQFLCETLLQPSFPGTAACYPPWLVEFYRRHFPAERTAPPRRLYIERKGKRGLTNAAEVREELGRRGFTPFDPAGQTDLSVQFADVTHIVGVHGASLANLVFCQPGTRVLELMPSDLVSRFYCSLCASAQLPYGVLIGKSLHERRRESDRPTHSPFTVPLDQFREALDVLLSVADVRSTRTDDRVN
jgi:capsular polysaccharide biosynthesis protein